MLKSIYIGKRILLGNQKILRILLVLVLILCIFASSVTAKACFCGEACLNSLQNTAKTRSSSPFHHRCLGTHCKSCNFEDRQTLQARNSCTPTGKLKTLDTSFLLYILTDFPPENHIIKGSCPRICASLKVQSSPIYIQNLSLLF